MNAQRSVEKGIPFPGSQSCVSISSPALLHIFDHGTLSYGGRQRWYPTWFLRKSGCGIVTAANLIWYLAASRQTTCGMLFNAKGNTRLEMLRLMLSVCRYVRPGIGGIYKLSKFAKGGIRYGKKQGVPLKARILKVSGSLSQRPSFDTVLNFLRTSFSEDLPVAFLNRSNGTVSNLPGWHWVTLVSTDDELLVEIYDQSCRQRIDLKQWLAGKTLGGGFVVLKPAWNEIKDKSRKSQDSY